MFQGLKWLFGKSSGFFKWIFSLFGIYRKFIPGSLLAIFVVSDFFRILFNEGVMKSSSWLTALTDLSTKVLGAEKKIAEITTLAINNDPSYNLYSLYSLLMSCYLLYILWKWLKKQLEQSLGANVNHGASVISIIIILLIELVTIKIIDGVMFIPIKDGIWYMIQNSEYLLNNLVYTFW